MSFDKTNKTYIGDVMSNFDHSIEKDIAEELKFKDTYAGYPAWGFHGTVWYEDEKYYCEIRRYHNLIDIISADTLEEIMEEASNEYGWN